MMRAALDEWYSPVSTSDLLVSLPSPLEELRDTLSSETPQIVQCHFRASQLRDSTGTGMQ